MSLDKVIHRKPAPTSLLECKQLCDEESIDYMDSLQMLCKKVRTTKDPTITSNERWDMPKVVCSCGKTGNEIISRDCCRATIKAKNCHKKLIRVLPGPLDSNYPPKGMGIHGSGYRVGHCAEPHAANTLLRETNCNISQIIFGTSFATEDGSPRPACITCKATFKQLR